MYLLFLKTHYCCWAVGMWEICAGICASAFSTFQRPAGVVGPPGVSSVERLKLITPGVVIP